MKKLLIPHFFIIFAILTANCQIYQGTGQDITSQYNQLKKTNDSLKTAIATVVSWNNSLTGLLSTANKLNEVNKTVIIKYKQDSANHKYWVENINAQMRLKMDSIKALKASVNLIILMNDSLKLANYNIQYQFEKYKSQQFSDTIEFIGFTDTIPGTYTKITEKQYAIAPKFTWQVLKRYPIATGQGIKTKEITITEFKK